MLVDARDIDADAPGRKVRASRLLLGPGLRDIVALAAVWQRREAVPSDVDAPAVAVARIALIEAGLRNFLAGVEAVSNVRHCSMYLLRVPVRTKRAQRG